jgi:hypothetical protein
MVKELKKKKKKILRLFYSKKTQNCFQGEAKKLYFSSTPKKLRESLSPKLRENIKILIK